MSALLAASLLWLALHLGVAGSSLRGVIVARIGEQAFRGLFTVASIGVFAFLIWAFIHAPRTSLWVTSVELRWVLVLLMLPAMYLLLASFSTISANPADAGTRRDGARGILRVTRHPMMWAFSLWSVVHILGTGELSALLCFGTFLVTAVAGMPSIDHKFARRDPLRWQQVAAETSILPGGAILAGRNRLIWAEIGWIVPLASLLLWAGLLFAHRHIFGVAPVPL